MHPQTPIQGLNLPPQTETSPTSGEQRIVLYGVTWKNYLLVRQALDSPGLRMTYLEGALELMTTSFRHEDIKKTVARLIEVYALERDIALYGYGQATFQYEARERGVEPDECYTLDRPLEESNEYPDLVVEVVLTHGGIDKLKVYQGFKVPEVWIWKDGVLEVYHLGENGYTQAAKSELLPDLDLEALTRYANKGDQHKAIVGFRNWLRERANTASTSV